MKKLILVLLALAMFLTGCATKTVTVEVPVNVPVDRIVEIEKQTTSIKWLTERGGPMTFWVSQKYRELTGVDVQVILTQSPDGTTSEMDALFAAGDAPNIYTAYGGRTSKYYNVAIPLDITEQALKGFIPGMFDLTKNSQGEIVGVPFVYWIQNGGINKDLVKKYGLESYLPAEPDRTWTIAQFNTMAEAFAKAKAADEYVAFLYAASGSGDYWMQLFEKGLGAHPLYDANGKLDVAPLAGPWATFKQWVDKGWVPAGVEGLNDDMFVTVRAEGKLLFSGAAPTGIGMSVPTYVCSYPSLDGSFVPFAVAPTVHIAIPCDDADKDAAAKAFVEWLLGKELVKIMAENEWHTRVDLPQATFVAPAGSTEEFAAEVRSGVEWMTAMLAKYGVMNIGIGSTQYQNVRTLRATKLAEFMAGKPLGQALSEFQAQGEAFLK